jgi:hypothetical protein
MLYPGGLAVRATMEAKAQLSWLSFLPRPFFWAEGKHGAEGSGSKRS